MELLCVAPHYPAAVLGISRDAGFNDAVSVASDLTAAQLVVKYWTDSNPWVVPLIFFVFLVGVNAFHVGAYGELGGPRALSFAGSLSSDDFSRRILALKSQDRHHHRIHSRWHPGQCGCQHGPSLHRV